MKSNGSTLIAGKNVDNYLDKFKNLIEKSSKTGALKQGIMDKNPKCDSSLFIGSDIPEKQTSLKTHDMTSYISNLDLLKNTTIDQQTILDQSKHLNLNQ